VSQPEKSAGNYICWHLFTEKYIEQSGLGYVHLRPNMFIDNLIEYGTIETYKEGILTFPIKPSLRLPWVSTQDIGAVSAGVLINPQKYNKEIIPITSELNNVNGIIDIIDQVSRGNKSKLITPTPGDFYTNLVSTGSEPAYMYGFKVNVEEHNQLEDATSAWGAREGLDSVRKIGRKEPQTIRSWAEENKEKWSKPNEKDGGEKKEG